jgi:hypothetical protein
MSLLLWDKSLWLWLWLLLRFFQHLIHISHICTQNHLINCIILFFRFPLSYVIWILRYSFIETRVGALKTGCRLRCHYWLGPSTIIAILKLYSVKVAWDCCCCWYIRCFSNRLWVWRSRYHQGIRGYSILMEVSQISRLNCWNIFFMISSSWTLSWLLLESLVSSKASLRIQSWGMIHCLRCRFCSQHVRLTIRRWILWSNSTYLPI